MQVGQPSSRGGEDFFWFWGGGASWRAWGTGERVTGLYIHENPCNLSRAPELSERTVLRLDIALRADQ